MAGGGTDARLADDRRARRLAADRLPTALHQGPPLTGNLVDTLLEWLRDAPECFETVDQDDDPLEFATFAPSTAGS